MSFPSAVLMSTAGAEPNLNTLAAPGAISPALAAVTLFRAAAV
jgi:hypothetical protein